MQCLVCYLFPTIEKFITEKGTMKSKTLLLVLLAALLASCAPAGDSTSPANPTATPIPTVPATPTSVPIGPLAGNWTGTFKGVLDGFTADIDISIHADCPMGGVCGTYSAPSLPCSGTLSLTRIENSTYIFTEQWTEGADWCGSGGLEHMELLPDQTLSWGFSQPGKSIQSQAVLTRLEEVTGKTWESRLSLLSDAPFVFTGSPEFWDQGEIPGAGIVFSAGTRWTFDIEVDGVSKDATGISLRGFAANGDKPTLGLYYHTGAWHLGYSPVDKFVYWWDFKELTSPKQRFTVTIFRDGKRLSIENSEGFRRDITYQPKIFDGADYVTVGYLVSPKIDLSLSNLVAEQLHDPSAPAPATVKLDEPYTASFEELDLANPADVSPFRVPTFLEMVLFYVRDPRTNIFSPEMEFAPWAVDERAHSGKYALNDIPGGNPPTKYMTPLTIAALDPVFDTTGYDTVTLKLWLNTTSNPRKARDHNCDTSLNIFYKTAPGEVWQHYTLLCGENVKESQGWHEVSLDFNVKGKSTIQFAFVYEAQNIPQADPDVYYLLDDLEVTAK